MCVLMLKSSHRPDGENADVLASTHAWTTANASGKLQEVRATETLKISHRPDGKMPYPDGIFTCFVRCAFRVAVSMSLEAR